MPFDAARFPVQRPRRLRSHPKLRDLVRERALGVDDLIYPLFVYHGRDLRREIASMPGQYQLSLDRLGEVVAEVADLKIPGVLLFGIPSQKDATGSGASDDSGLVQEATRLIKRQAPELLVITDVCFCEYTDHGHCGPLIEGPDGRVDVDNDATLPLLARQAVSHARAGADVVAPSGMMDGMVAAIRAGLDEAGFSGTPILSYAAKFASAYYGPFRDAAESAPSLRRPPDVSDGPGQRRRGPPRGGHRPRRGGRPGDGQARPGLPRHRQEDQGDLRASPWPPTTSRASTP